MKRMKNPHTWSTEINDFFVVVLRINIYISTDNVYKQKKERYYMDN